jgi:glycoprotein-N-acetylgalactosamine 3-beta-galactosyltransferase
MVLAKKLPHTNARRLSSNRRSLLMLGVILLTAWTLRASVREFDSGDYTYTISLSRTTKTKEVIMIANFWMPVVLEDKATTLATPEEVDMSKKTTVSVATRASTTLDFNQTKRESAAIISFIIPSTLRRATLNRTIESLQKQSRSNWEAIVGVDLAISNLTEKQVASASLSFKQDRRVRYVPITFGSTNRGGEDNRAGEVRNQIIRNYATAKWVAFVDDDDTLSPDYIEHWETGRQHDQSADVIIFRMVSRGKRILPPLAHGSTASQDNVGISYAVRKDLFVRKQNGIAFVPHTTEEYDYNLLKQGQTCNAPILISDCVTYFERHTPLISLHQTSCRFTNATIADRPPSKKRNDANHSHAAVTTTLSHTNAAANKTLAQSEDPPRPHPHAGARDASGNWGYVADVTRIRRWVLQRYRETSGVNATVSSSSLVEAVDEALPPASYLPLTANETEKVCGTQPGKGIEGKHGWDVVIKVVLDGTNPLPLPSSEERPRGPKDKYTNIRSSMPYVRPRYMITTPEPDGVSKGKILCGIYTYDKMNYRIQGVSETWGWRCDGFLPVSTVTIDDPAIQGYGSVDVPHYGPEEYNNMWQKTRSILAYMYDNYFDDFEYFYLAGDDTHLIVENLRRYLYTVEQKHDAATEPLYMGMPRTYRTLYNSGGAGYVLNRVALKRLVLEAFPTCHAKNQVSAEDRFVGKCLKSMQIDPLHTVDAQGRQRFLGKHPNDIGRNKGMKSFHAEWGKNYGWRTGADLVSESSITFHMFRTQELMKRHHAIIYNSCPVGSVLHTAVQKGRDARGNSTVAAVARR